MAKKLIHFDWAVKKILRNKANFVILEGFLTELLKFEVKIESILESEGNQEEEYDKFNRVDILVKNDKEELVLVEIQNNPQQDYFHRMLYGVSKLVTEYIKLGDIYGSIKKVFSINIVYFDLGQGDGYVYEYEGNFVDLHSKEILKPSITQKKLYKIEKIADIYPKYYILKVNNFDDNARDTLDEWIYFLKNSEVKDNFQAKGLAEAKEQLDYEELSPKEKKAYERYADSRRIEKSVKETLKQEGWDEGLEKGLEKKAVEVAKKAIRKGSDNEFISDITSLSIDEIEKIRKEIE